LFPPVILFCILDGNFRLKNDPIKPFGFNPSGYDLIPEKLGVSLSVKWNR